MRKRKKHIYLPLKIPQNIIDVLVSYREWQRNQDNYPKTKLQLLKELDKACLKWHLYCGWESMGGSFFIYTKVGITIYTHINSKKPFLIQQCNECNPWEGKYNQVPLLIIGKEHIYHWENYEPMTFPE